ncbi:MAG: ATP-binding cassette domain-containing protein [Candidatus Dormibacteria bacterium]
MSGLSHVSLTVEDGEFLTIQGPSGSGKTVLLLPIGALGRATSGTRSWTGRAPAGWERAASVICGRERSGLSSGTTT